jgi:biofilm PGA synthesis N-glycosyltransferase PgaC
MPTENRYVLISPAKDEARYIARTIESVLRQTLQPVRWIIVDDGSQDATAAIVASYAERHPFITLLKTEQATERAPGPGVVRAFMAGYEAARREVEADFVVKLDCDLELPPEYFAELVKRFQADARLGIASGVYLEQHGAAWKAVKMPEYHAAGAAKMMRTACFAEIGGFIPRRGWDTVDEIRANARGWRTRHFRELEFRHLRPEGSAVGFLRTHRESGAGHYLMGGGKVFFALKVLQRCVRGRPPVLGGLAMAYGYLSAWATRSELIVTRDEAESYRRLLNRRMSQSLSRLLPLARTAEKGQ